VGKWQPRSFAVITDERRKQRIHDAAEKEERDFDGYEASQKLLYSLALMGIDPDKPFLEAAPVLITIFAQSHGIKTPLDQVALRL
jgi:hypothetical protein